MPSLDQQEVEAAAAVGLRAAAADDEYDSPRNSLCPPHPPHLAAAAVVSVPGRSPAAAVA